MLLAHPPATDPFTVHQMERQLPVSALNHQRGLIEVSFRSAADDLKPGRDVELDVTFTSPSHQCLVVPAFWAGGQVWRARYSSAEVGRHRFRTRCSDPGNVGLHDQTGQVEVEPYLGDNPLYRHGGLCVASDRRHFCHADGTPFFWLGDTWWMGLCQRLAWPHDFQTLVQNRKELGFNLVQLVAGLYPDMALFDERGRSRSGFAWEHDLSQINPGFFDEADQRVLHLVEQGLVPCLIGAWGYYLPMIGLDNMKRHWRNLMARWGALPVVWAAAGEQTMPWYLEREPQRAASAERLKQDWTEVMRYMRRINGFGRLITTHPTTSARESVSEASLVDFEMQQTNHALPTAHHAARAQEGWHAQPNMPVISAEARYEALEIHPSVTARDAREAFWAHTLNSGAAGHTYGANGIWQVNTEGMAFGQSASGRSWGTLPWNRAMQLPGAKHIGLGRRFLESLPWTQLQPLPMPSTRLQRLLLHRPRLRRVLHRLGWQPTPPHPVAVCSSLDRSLVLAYSVLRQPFTIDSALLPTPWRAEWIDPTSFEVRQAEHERLGAACRFVPDRSNAAGESDWLLRVQPGRPP